MADQYMPKSFHGLCKNSSAPPPTYLMCVSLHLFYVINVSIFKLIILESGILSKNYVNFDLCLTITSQFYSDNLLKVSFFLIYSKRKFRNILIWAIERIKVVFRYWIFYE